MGQNITLDTITIRSVIEISLDEYHCHWQKFSNALRLHVCLFVFVALRPMSTAMVIAGRSVHLTTLFPGQA